MCQGGVISSIFGGAENIINAGQVNAVAKGNEKTVRSKAALDAENIKKQSAKNASSARAAAAENGLDVDTGAAAMIQDEIIGDGAYNATMTTLDANYQGKLIRQQGKMQRNNYGMKAASSFIDAGAQAMGWK